mmetsp:Transcript_19201/g.44154  ORF Transcript_19201/g.44154 Transcript_19201/m.44154 type:complete len:531 (-) Transcript_19201:188-1780(-)|eukprot:CAMPEP_0204303748 /NCGR_PEP_ID=MMETSP0468-20130131/84065_1 /ASSEMBLY_ACC=CAM_ASM_000383 /TAXON_ID=2969 /ORGANISM="Oxyrrhis marina" /LENGTH=530 /DNA_ID=CAMNT_0051283067 /DNA_START=57 /DNA_END=1649 /DNA_ORIENTATION=-
MRLLTSGCMVSGAFAAIDLILPPADKSGKPAGLVLISGAQISNTAYNKTMVALQEAAAQKGISLYCGSPWYLGDTPQPVDLKQRVNNIHQEFTKAGLTDGSPQFYAAHSLGTVFLQDFVASLGSEAAGQILMGGFILRKSLVPTFNYSVPTLTMGAELDGLARVTRIAESAYHTKDEKNFPVVVLEGQNHMQFASGDPPSNVRKHDLEAEVSEEAAHAKIAAVGADFLAQRMGLSSGDVVAAQVSSSQDVLKAIADAYEMEGSRRFNAPAQAGGPDEKSCVRGLCPTSSAWAPTAQQVISQSAVPDYNLKVTNAYVDLGGSPVTGKDFHLPNVTTSGKDMTITTYSGCYWNDKLDEIYDDLDTGFTFTSAQEIGTKLYSRQCTLNVGAGKNVSFSEDDPDFCAQTNKMAYDWALKHAPAKSASRFQSKGVPFVFGADVQKAGGPLFLGARLQFTEKQQDGKNVMEVVSFKQATEQNYWEDHFHIPRPSAIPDPGCYHYCKLLSPARVMEWMLVDGLRTQDFEMELEAVLI